MMQHLDILLTYCCVKYLSVIEGSSGVLLAQQYCSRKCFRAVWPVSINTCTSVSVGLRLNGRVDSSSSWPAMARTSSTGNNLSARAWCFLYMNTNNKEGTREGRRECCRHRLCDYV